MTWRFLTLSVDAVLTSGGYRSKGFEKKIRNTGIWGMIFDRTRTEVDDEFIRLWMPTDLKFERLQRLFHMKTVKNLSKSVKSKLIKKKK